MTQAGRSAKPTEQGKYRPSAKAATGRYRKNTMPMAKEKVSGQEKQRGRGRFSAGIFSFIQPIIKDLLSHGDRRRRCIGQDSCEISRVFHADFRG
jgi:hypothetical protein